MLHNIAKNTFLLLGTLKMFLKKKNYKLKVICKFCIILFQSSNLLQEILTCIFYTLKVSRSVKKRSGYRIFSEEKQKCREERRLWMHRRNKIADSLMRCGFEPRTHDRASLLRRWGDCLHKLSTILQFNNKWQVQGPLCISIIFTYLCTMLLVTIDERRVTSDYRQFFHLNF